MLDQNFTISRSTIDNMSAEEKTHFQYHYVKQLIKRLPFITSLTVYIFTDFESYQYRLIRLLSFIHHTVRAQTRDYNHEHR